MRPAALLPYPGNLGLRPVALRPTLSDGLPFSSDFYFSFTEKTSDEMQTIGSNARKMPYKAR